MFLNQHHFNSFVLIFYSLFSISLFSCHDSGVTLSTESEYKKLETNGMEFYWKKEAGNLLKIKMVAVTEGWLGVGFNPIDRMYGATMVLGYIKRDEEGVVEEHYGDTVQTHRPVLELDMQKSITDGKIEKQGKQMVMTFTIPLKTILKNQKGDQTKILLAFGKTHRLSSYHALNRVAVDLDL